MSLHLPRQTGYTLIEMMIAVVLGLLIIAAGLQLFITGQASYRMQRNLSDIQENANLGLGYIVTDIKKANLGAPVAMIHDKVPYAGVILTADNVGDYLTINSQYFSKNNTALSAATVQVDGVDVNSDQLVIRYQPQQPSYDCAGAEITQADVSAGIQIVQRYFVGTDLALRCVAARYRQVDIDVKKAGDAAIALDLSGQGQVIIPRVDYFYIKLGVATGSFDSPSELRYLNVTDYLDVADDVDLSNPGATDNVRAIQVGVLLSASNSMNDAAVNARNAQPFNVLDQSVTLKDAQKVDHLVRKVITYSVSLRNALGEGAT